MSSSLTIDGNRLPRVVVVGTSGAGKTTLAASLSRALGAPHIQLDALHWGPNWTERPRDEFNANVEAAIAEQRWVLDGNYSQVRDRVWRRATTLVWLNYSFPRVYWRAISRTIRRVATQEELYSGNRESLRNLIDPDWIPYWVPRTYSRRRREYRVLIEGPAFAHLQVLEFTEPAQAEYLLERARAGKN